MATCELSQPDETIVTDNGVTIIAPTNIPATMPAGAATFYARNISALLTHFVKDGAMNYDFSDEITAATVITYRGEVVHAPTAKLLGQEPAAAPAPAAAPRPGARAGGRDHRRLSRSSEPAVPVVPTAEEAATVAAEAAAPADAAPEAIAADAAETAEAITTMDSEGPVTDNPTSGGAA